VDCSKVAEIIDHHPGGNPEAFEKASIINEQVGAAATIVVERFQKMDFGIQSSHVGLLYAGIMAHPVLPYFN
jgi:nanoRNase/pAp phosphatase (c-di-AMP/oligoRNAs hydrolase)